MSVSLRSRFKNAWNVFRNKNPVEEMTDIGPGYYYRRPDRIRLTRGNERSIVNSIYNRIAIDAASVDIQHVRLDEDGRYQEVIDDSLNRCLTLEANTDQTGRAFIQDIVMSLCDEGVVAIVPVDFDDDPEEGSSGILSLRTGKIVTWYPQHVRVNLYNELIGDYQEITLPKRMIGVVENPFFSIMNELNGMLNRLTRKLNLSDIIDEQQGANKLDLIIQLPYVVKSEVKRKEAKQRLEDIQNQLKDSEFGIAYTDGTERITQLNRAVENNLMSQIEYLTSMLFSQLGLTQEILNGTADEQTMLNYEQRTIVPFLSAIVEEMNRKFLTQTARSQRQTIMYFRDPFKLVPVNSIAEIADKMTRNEIMTPNEVRRSIGMKPSTDEKADELRNRNINQAKQDMAAGLGNSEEVDGSLRTAQEEEENQNGE